MPYLSLLIFVPVLAALIALVIPTRYTRAFPWLTLAATVLQLFIFIAMATHFNPADGLQLSEKNRGYQFLSATGATCRPITL